MESTLLFVFGCVLCLMFLAMLYGERLSMVGLFEGEWLSPVGVVLGRAWSGLCESVDRSLEFVLTHLSWVVAAVSGTAGLILVAFLMGGGLASDAVAYHRDLTTPLKAGGVIDLVEAVPTRTALPASVLKSETDVSEFVSQERTLEYAVFGRPERSYPRPRPRRPIEGGVLDEIANRPDRGQPDLDVSFRRLSSSMLLMEEVPDIVTRGRLVDRLPDPQFVSRILRGMLRDNWREGLGDLRAEPGLPQEGLPESPLSALQKLESGIRVTPGLLVSEHDLRVTKEVPEESATGEMTVVVNIRNMGQETIDGLIVREILPLRTVVRGAEPRGVLRNETLTWRIDDLRPAEEDQLRFTVIPGDSLENEIDQVFSSRTEVSALTAVTTETRVQDERPSEPFASDRRRRTRETIGVPDLRLAIETPDDAIAVGEKVNVYFSVTNAGTAEATNVRLLLTLDDRLDHDRLPEGPERLRKDLDRRVDAGVNRLEPGETRRLRLEVQPTSSGTTLSTAEILLEGQPVGRKAFRLAAENNRRLR